MVREAGKGEREFNWVSAWSRSHEELWDVNSTCPPLGQWGACYAPSLVWTTSRVILREVAPIAEGIHFSEGAIMNGSDRP